MAQPNPQHLTEKELLRFIDKSELAQKIIAAVSKAATVIEMAIKTGNEPASIQYHLKRFVEHGLIKKSGSYKHIYTLTETGQYYLEKIRPAIYHLL